MLKNKSLLSVFLMVFLLQFGLLEATAANVSHGVYHSKDSVVAGGYTQTVNQLSINLNQPYTTINIGVSSPINKLLSVTNLAKLHTQTENHVVGAINASFFHFSNGYPSYLLMKDSKIHHLGAVSTNYNDYMHTPAAFGMTADNTAKIGTYDMSIQIEHGGKTSQLTSLNRERSIDESILFTSSWSYDRTRTNATGMEIVVETPKSIEQNIALGEKVTGQVIGIRQNGQATSATIPQNGRGFVISAHGKEVDKIRNMKIGENVSVSFNVDDNWKDANFMLATGPLLVQNGRVALTIDPTSTKARQRTARTAVATDNTGKRAFFVTVDSNRNGKTGMTLNEFAAHLVTIGAHNAINLDGGGSTTMVTRKYGDVYPTLTNQPSDGLRGVSAILEAVSTAPYSDPHFVRASQAETGIVAVDASVSYQVNSVLDKYYNVLSIDQSKLILNSVTNGVGIIENNRFVGKKAGSGSVLATYEGASVTVPVTVTDTIDDLLITPSEIRVGSGEVSNISVQGISKNNKVIFNSDAANLTVSPSIGTIEGKTFYATNNESSGILTATFGRFTKNVPIIVSDQPLYLGSFESSSGIQATTARATASIAVENKIQPVHMNNSLRLNYDFTAYKEDVSAAYMTWTNGFKLPAQPKKLGVWVYGDGKNHWLRGSLSDTNGKEVVIDFTSESGLNWTGWKYVEAAIPQSVPVPLTLNRIYVAETNSAKKDKGFVLFDKLQVHYSDKHHVEQSFVPSSSAREVATNKKFTVTFTQSMKKEFFTNKYIYVEDVNGVRQAVTISPTADARKVEISAPANGYTTGQNYRLVVTHFAQSDKNVSMVRDNKTEFKVK